MKKRIFSMLLAVCMLFSNIPVTALATGTTTSPGISIGDSGKPEEMKECICETKCTPVPVCTCDPAPGASGDLDHGEDCPLGDPETDHAVINKDCPVCGAEKADLADCKGKAPAPECVCETKCTPVPECICPPVDSGKVTEHGEDCPLGDPETDHAVINKDCAVCSAEKADLEKVCKGAAAMMMAASVTGQIWNGTSAKYFEGGTGTETDPYLIATAEQLVLLSGVINQYTYNNGTDKPYGTGTRTVIANQGPQTYDYLQKAHYKLTADIVLNDISGWENWDKQDPETTKLNKWKPIGTSEKQFSGTFDGGGFTVSGMYFNDTKGSLVGLFGNNSGIIENLTVAESYIEGSVSVGGVVGYSAGPVTSCTNSGTVSGYYNVGGVVGNNDVVPVTSCTNSGAVSGTYYVGGVVGDSRGPVTSCTNSGAVSGSYNVGGVVGQNTGTVTSCTNSGTVSGTVRSPVSVAQYVGGVVGISQGPVTSCTNSGTVSGMVSGKNYVGGVVGFSDKEGTIANCTSPKGLTKDATGNAGMDSSFKGHIIGQNKGSYGTGNSSDGVDAGVVLTPKGETLAKGTTQQFTATIDGADSADAVTWSVVGGDGNATIDETGLLTVLNTAVDGTNYVVKAVSTDDPTKFGMASVTVGTPSGTPWNGTADISWYNTTETEFTITTAEQLAGLAQLVNGGTQSFNGKTITLGADIVLNDTTNWENWAKTAPAHSWKSIGLSSATYFFGGTFDGCGFTVKGMYNTNANPAGLFGYSSGTIKNLTVAESYINGGGCVGGVVGFSQGTVTNCTNSGTVSGSGTVYGSVGTGGVVGFSQGTVTNCTNSGTVSGERFVGGVVGTASGDVTDCKNSGAVSITVGANVSEFMGGVAGGCSGAVTNCTNSGAVSGSYNVGGVVGASGTYVTNCINSGAVSGSYNVGGVVGMSSQIVENCTNSGTVSGESHVGGVLGYILDYGTVTGCTNSGTVSGSYNVGGVVGYNSIGSVTSCTNSGTVSGSYNVGGVVGANYRGSITNCTSPKGLAKDATGDIGVSNLPNIPVGHVYLGHIIGYGGYGTGTGNSSDGVDAGVSVTPKSVTLKQDAKQQYTAVVTGETNQTVTWTVSGKDGKVAISETGLLTVASDAVDGTIYVVKAVSTADSAKYGTASVMVSPPIPTKPTITETLPNGMVGTAYSGSITATGYPAPALSITAGALPAGLTLNTTTGAVTGTPTVSGKFDFTVKAKNTSDEVSKALSITVNSNVTGIAVTPATATVKQTKSQQFTANVTSTATDKSVSWSVTGGNGKSKIDASGLLKIAETETVGAVLTVTATAKADSAKTATAKVTVAAAPKMFTVTFESNGGSTMNPITDVEDGNTIVISTSPTKADHRFDGWYTAQTGGTRFISGVTPVTASITLYARWTEMFTISGTVVDYDDTPVTGASVTLSPKESTSAVTTGADGKFSFVGVPKDLYSVSAVYPAGGGTVTVNVDQANPTNIVIKQPKPYITFATQPGDAVIVKGLANGKGGDAKFRVVTQRTPHIQDRLGTKWWWLKGTIPDAPDGGTDIEVAGAGGSEVTFNNDNNNVPDRGVYRLYARTRDGEGQADPAYSRVATLRVLGLNTVAGVIKNEDGTAVGGATVKLEKVFSYAPAESPMTSSTNPQTTIADGKYEFKEVPDGKYNIIVTLPGGGVIKNGPYDFPGPNPPAPTDPPAPIDPGIVLPSKAEIRINSQPQDATVKNGTVVTLKVDAASTDSTTVTYQWYKDGTAIAGAIATTYTPPTADKGTASYYCMVSGGTLAAVTTRTAKVTVFTYGIIAGTVLTENKQPIKDAVVELISLDNPPPADFENILPVGKKITTISDGKYKFTEVPDGTYKLKITLPGGEIFEKQPINVPGPTIDIPLTPPGKPIISITRQPKNLTVVQGDTAEFTVSAGVSSGNAPVYQWYSNTTNSATGGTVIDSATTTTYRAPTAVKGEAYYYCVVNASGADAVTSSVAKLTVRNTPLNNLMTIEGDVVDDTGAKVEGAIVTLSPKAGNSENPQTTEADGKYKFENLPEGKYTITVKLPDGGTVGPIEITIDDGKITPLQPFEIKVPATNEIKITQQPKSIEVTTDMTAKFSVTATASKSDTLTYQWYKNTTDAATGGTEMSGKTGAILDLGKQPVGESWYYCVVKSNGAPDVTSAAAKLTVTKAEGDKGNIDGDLVDDENGDPVADATVKLMKYGTDGTQFGATVTTGKDGKFNFTAVPYGTYSLVAQKDTSVVTRMITIKEPDTTAKLTMPSGIKLTKVVIEGSGTPSAAVGNLEGMFTTEDTDTAKTPGASVEIKLVVEKVTDPTDKTEIDNSINTETQEVGIYLDARLIRTITGAVANAGTEAIQPPSGETVRIVLDLPKALQDKIGYVILRSHEGDVSEIRPTYDAALKTLSFEADAFSTYAVAFDKVLKYTATIAGGGIGATGGGDYAAGNSVSINAGAKNGFTFNGWTSADSVTFGDASSAATTFTMPAKPVTVTANWKQDSSSTTHTVTVLGSYAGAGSGGGVYATGTTVTISAGSRSGYSFTGWTVTGATLANASSATTTFTMPANNVTVTAGWKSNGGGGGGDNDDDDDNGGSSSKPGGGGSSSSNPGGNNPGGNNPGGNNPGGGGNGGGTTLDGSSSDGNTGSSSDTGSGSENEKASPTDPDKAKDDALLDLAEKREETIAALPDTLTDEQRQAALDEIDRIYTEALAEIQSADTAEKATGAYDKAVSDFDALLAGLGVPTSGKASGGKPFVLLSALLVLAAIASAVLLWLRDIDKKRKLIAIGCAAVAALVFLLTSGFGGFAFANLWTLLVALFAAVPAFFFVRNAKEDKE